MSGKRFAVLSLGAALLAFVVFMGGLWFLFRQDSGAEIHLPEPLPQGLWPGQIADTAPPGAPYAPLELSPARARDILLGLGVPENYSQNMQTTLFWEGGSLVQNHQWQVKGDLRRVETREESGPAQISLFADGILYRWTEGKTYYNQSRFGNMRPEELIGTPTLDILLSLPEEQIEFVEYIDGQRLRFVTKERYYRGEYHVSLEEGLLVLARYTEADGEIVYQSLSLLRRLETPPPEAFLLPNGTQP